MITWDVLKLPTERLPGRLSHFSQMLNDIERASISELVVLIRRHGHACQGQVAGINKGRGAAYIYFSHPNNGLYSTSWPQ